MLFFKVQTKLHMAAEFFAAAPSLQGQWDLSNYVVEFAGAETPQTLPAHIYLSTTTVKVLSPML